MATHLAVALLVMFGVARLARRRPAALVRVGAR